MIAQFDQGGLGLPDRDYYLKDDPESVEIRHKYVAHLQKMFELAGEKADQAKARRRRRHAASRRRWRRARSTASRAAIRRRCITR